MFSHLFDLLKYMCKTRFLKSLIVFKIILLMILVLLVVSSHLPLRSFLSTVTFGFLNPGITPFDLI